MAELKAPEQRSALHHRSPVEGDHGTVRMAERPFIAKFILRADPQQAVERLRAALGLELPFDPLTSSQSPDSALLWMGPDEWMLVSAPEWASMRFQAAATALSGTRHQLVDVSDYHTVVEVAGAKARELLMKLTTLDLHPRAFKPGMVTGAILGRANAAIWLPVDEAPDSGPAFRLFVRWSMADYLWCLLADAGREWGVPEQIPTKGEKLTIAD